MYRDECKDCLAVGHPLSWGDDGMSIDKWLMRFLNVICMVEFNVVLPLLVLKHIWQNASPAMVPEENTSGFK